jgi:Flp pilus assembly protein TadG
VIAHRRSPGPASVGGTGRARGATWSSDSEKGTVVLITAAIMIVLLIMASIVVDLGSARAHRRRLQNVTDFAALAAGYALSGHANSTVTADPRGACTSAFRSIRSNLRTIPATATLACTTLAASADAPDCTGTTAMKTVTSSGAGAYTVQVSYPVPDSEIALSQYEGIGFNDGEQCTRMRVKVSQDQSVAFAGVVGRTSLQPTASSVVRGGIDTQNGGVPALLSLERTGCQAVTNASNGSGNLGIIVRAVSTTQGGHVHSDSNGSECGTNSTAYTIYGASNSNGGTSITVGNGSNGVLGTISSYATASGSLRGASTYPTGISHPGTAGPVVGRQPFDRQFNPTARPAVANLHAAGWTAVARTGLQALAAGYTVVTCGADGTVSGTKIYVNCLNYQPNNAFFNNAEEVVFNGQVTVGSGKTLNMPSVNRVYVRGCPSCTGGNYYSVSVAGGLYVNIGNNAIASATCDQRLGPGAGGSTTNTTVLATYGGPLQITGQARICQTTVYLGANTATYTRQATTSGLPNCSGALPCPIKTGAAPGGSYAISGDYTDWTAPNQQSTVADASQPLEDIALWTESSDLSEIKSGGVLVSAGIFFTPNAQINFRSPASGTPRNAQFVSRTIQLLQGTLDMRPVSSDAVRVPLPGGYGLIR